MGLGRDHEEFPLSTNITWMSWMIAICNWLIKKLLYLVNVSYNKLRQILTVPSSSSTWTKNFDLLVETMRFERELLLQTISEKMSQFSEDSVQIIRTTTEATQKVTEDMQVLQQELKKFIRETLEEMFPYQENRRNTVVASPRGPFVSLEMLRNVKLNPVKRRPNDQPRRSPRTPRTELERVVKSVKVPRM